MFQCAPLQTLRSRAFAGVPATEAIRATFDRRKTPLPTTTPLPLTSEFSTDRGKATQWNAFVRKGRLIASPPPFSDVVELLESFLMPPARALASNKPWDARWSEPLWS